MNGAERYDPQLQFSRLTPVFGLRVGEREKVERRPESRTRTIARPVRFSGEPTLRQSYELAHGLPLLGRTRQVVQGADLSLSQRPLTWAA